MSFQWYRNGEPLPGATERILTITEAQPSHSGDYFVIISNAQGDVCSATVSLESLEISVLRAYADGELLHPTIPVRRVDKSVVTLTSEFPSGSIFYTTDGSAPSLWSARYDKPIVVTAPASIQAITYSADFLEVQEGGPYQVQVFASSTLSTLTRIIDGGGSIAASPYKTLYFLDDVVTLTATPAGGWYFVEWRGDVIGSSPNASILMDSSKSVTAVFASYAILTTLISGDGAVTRSPVAYYFLPGEQVLLTATPAAGWRFRQWMRGATGTEATIVVTMDISREIVAVFDPIPSYSLTTPTPGKGTIHRSNDGPYLEGSTVELTAIPAEGWQFVRWEGDASGTDPTISLSVNGNMSVEAVFGTGIATSALGGGRLELRPAAGPYPYNSTLLVFAVPDPGNSLAAWGGSASGSANPLMPTVIPPNPQISGAFAPHPPNKHLLTVAVQGGGSVKMVPPRKSGMTEQSTS